MVYDELGKQLHQPEEEQFWPFATFAIPRNQLVYGKSQTNYRVPNLQCTESADIQETDPAWEPIIESEEPENLNSTVQVDGEGVDPPYVGEFSLLEHLRASGPQKTGKRPEKLSAVDKDHLVKVVKRDWATRHMSLCQKPDCDKAD
ncbi:hypothetical protein HOY82DRAFT_607646 [Tuber indicum]|nr:hypothetical protein HOY82DRAFT_607646 [Tuber indicum]